MDESKRVIILSVSSPDGRSFEYLEDGTRVAGDDEYSPGLNRCLNGEDTYLKIDVDTGQILNWEKPTDEKIKEMMGDFGKGQE